MRLNFKEEQGQALAEAPLGIALVCVLCLLLIQPTVLLITKMAMGYTVAYCGRVVATNISQNKDEYLTEIAKEKLSILPPTTLFCIPDSVTLTREGSSDTPDIWVTLSLRQAPLPGLAKLLGANSQGQITLQKKVRVGGTTVGLKTTGFSEGVIVGEGWQD